MTAKKAAGRKAPAKPRVNLSGGKASTSLVRQRALAAGYNSGLEHEIAKALEAQGIGPVFETLKISYIKPEKVHTYTPDFPLPNGIVVETKGVFDTDDRTKHKLIKAQNPDLDLRFVFSNSRSKLSKGSPTSYGKWCEQHGFAYADKMIPQAWIDEPPCEVRLAALAAISKPSKKSTS